VEGKKEEYEKPVLRIIELAAEETLSIGCKTATQGGKLPIVCVGVQNCAGAGS
jgi:hypothetical protein